MHRWIGAIAALFLVLLSLTGLCLNHADRLHLHDLRIKWPYILHRYDMLTSQDIRSVRIGENGTLSLLDNGLYHNSTYVVESGGLAGVYEDDPFIVVAAENGLILLTPAGELIEVLSLEQLPFDEINGLGVDDSGRAVIVSGSASWIADDDWVEFQEYAGAFTLKEPDWTGLDTETEQAILAHYQGQGPSVYRVILDLHSGRLFGWKGRTVMDLTALAILVLVTSGITGWINKARRPRISFN